MTLRLLFFVIFCRHSCVKDDLDLATVTKISPSRHKVNSPLSVSHVFQYEPIYDSMDYRITILCFISRFKNEMDPARSGGGRGGEGVCVRAHNHYRYLYGCKEQSVVFHIWTYSLF